MVTAKLARHLGLFAIASTSFYLVVLPLLPVTQGENPHDLARLAQGLLFLLVLPCIVVANSRSDTVGARLPGTASRPLFALLCMLVSLSSLGAAVPPLAWREVVLIAGLVVLASGLAINWERESTRRWLAIGIIIAPASYCVTLLMAVTLGFAVGAKVEGWELIFGYANHRFLNHSQTVFIPLLAGIVALPALSARWRGLAGFALVISFALLVLTRGRGTMVALIAATAAAWFFGAQGRAFARRMLTAAVAGLVFHFVVFELIAEWLTGAALRPEKLAGVDSIEARLFLWKRAAALIAESPWLGAGPMHFAHMPGRPTDWDLFDAAAHPHNIYMQIGAEYGLPAAAIILTLVLGGLFHRMQALRRQEGQQADGFPLTLAAGLACVAAAVDGLFSGNFVMPTSQVWISVAAGILLARVQPLPVAQTVTASAPVRRAVIPLLLLASLLWLFSQMVADWRDGHQAQQRGLYRVTPPGAVEQPIGQSHPRFWLNGWF